MKLSDQIDALRLQMLAEQQSLLSKVSDLDKLVLENDAAVMRALNGIIEGQGRRASDIHRAMKTIQARIGHIPSDEHAHLYETAAARPTITTTPEDHDGAKEMAVRYAPPLRAESTSGDALGLYEDNHSGGSFGLN